MANKDKLIENAQKFLEKGQLPKAIGEYRKIVEAFPKDFRNRQKLAELLTREKHNDEAQPHYEAVAKNFTDTGFYLKAIAIYKQMQKLEPSRVDIYLRLAELNEKQGLIGNSLNEYRNLVALYEKNHKPQEALAIMRRMLALEPDNLAIRGKLVEMLVAADEQSEAFEHFSALDRILRDREDKAGIANLHAKFAALHSQMAEGQSRSALPADTADASPDADAAPLDATPEAVDRSAPSLPVAHPEREPGQQKPPAPTDHPTKTSAPSPPPPVELSPASAPLEIDLELDLDLPSAAEIAVVSLASATAAPVDEPSAPSPPLDALELPEFCDLDLALEPSAAAASEELAAAPPADDLLPPTGDTVIIDEERANASAEGPELFDGMEAIAEIGLDEEPPADDLYEILEELEELEELEDADVEASGEGFAASANEGLDAGVFMDRAGAASFTETSGAGSREDEEDAQSHFDLGIAYKEMGLLNEAIAELSKAAHEPSRRLDCLTLQGQCRQALGEYRAAEAAFKEALGGGGLTDEVRVALRYELGLLYEAMGRTLEALESYQFVADRDLFFRDVAVKLKALREALGLDDQSADGNGARPGRDRISYV